MSDFEAAQAAGTSPEGGVSPAPQAENTQAASVESSSGGVAPADEFADLAEALEGDPRKDAFLNRLREVASKRDEFKQQFSQYEPLSPWMDLVRGLGEAQLTPQDVIARLTQPAQAPTPPTPADPQEELHSWIQEQGVDPWELFEQDPDRYALMEQRFEVNQALQALRQEKQSAEMARQQAALEQEVSQIQQRFPVLQQKPAFGEAIVALTALAADNGLEVTLTQVAERFHQTLEGWKAEVLASYAADKQRDGQVPVTTGGSAPPPAEAPDVHNMSHEQRRALLSGMQRSLTTRV